VGCTRNFCTVARFSGYTWLCITGPLHELNRQLQRRKGTVSGMMETVTAVRNDLAARRSDQYFADIFQEALNAIGKLNLEPLQLPRCSRPPKRLAGPASSYQAATVDKHFRKSFFVVLDTAIQQLDDHWQILDGTGLHVYKQLEEVLLTGTVADVVQNYADINRDSLPAQLQMFIRHCQPRTVPSVRNAFHSRCHQTCVHCLKTSSYSHDY